MYVSVFWVVVVGTVGTQLYVCVSLCVNMHVLVDALNILMCGNSLRASLSRF